MPVNVLRVGTYCCGVLAVALSCSAQAEYKLAPGDVLEISISSAPELHQRAPINPDGGVLFPYVGQVQAGGSSIGEFRTKLQSALANKVVRKKDGESIGLISFDEISINIVEYRPIYVDGDVARPGEQAYRAGLTVGKAVSVAGGYQIAFLRTAPPVNLVDLQSEHEQLKVDLFKERVHLARLQSNFAGSPNFDASKIRPGFYNSSLAKEIVELEDQSSKARFVQYVNDIELTEKILAQSSVHLSILRRQLDRQNAGNEADIADLNRIRDLFDKGTVPMLRFTDVRRAQLLSEERVLQTRALIEQVKREQLETTRRAEQLREQLKSEINRDLQQTVFRIQSIEARVIASDEKSDTWRTGRASFTAGAEHSAKLVIVRDNSGRIEQVNASSDTQILPGDLLKVRLSTVQQPQGQ